MIRAFNQISQTWIPSVIWGIIITVFSIIPYPEFGLPFDTGDLSKHFAAYMLLSVFLFFPMRVRLTSMPQVRFIIIIVLICTLFGVMMELIQYLSPGRTPSVLDAIANFLGALFGQTLFMLRRKMAK